VNNGRVRLRPDHLIPHPRRFASSRRDHAAAMAAHAAAVAEGRATYRDPATGWQVFTAAYLADRGTCCDTGCRHCPYVGA
jgi:Family of unknown function (DUF5522)